MRKIIFISLIGLFSCLNACPHTDALKFFLRNKINRIVCKNNSQGERLTQEEIVEIRTYFTIIDYLSAID
jgi:hypothetical protein